MLWAAFALAFFSFFLGGTVALWLVGWTLDRAVQVQALVGDIVLCSWTTHFTLPVPLSPCRTCAGYLWTSIPSSNNPSIRHLNDAWFALAWVRDGGHTHFSKVSFLEELSIGTHHSSWVPHDTHLMVLLRLADISPKYRMHVQQETSRSRTIPCLLPLKVIPQYCIAHPFCA